MPPDMQDTGNHSLDNSGVMRAMALQAAGLPDGPGPHWIDARLLVKAAIHRVAPRAERQGVVIKVNLAQESMTVIGFAPMLLKALDLVVANAMSVMAGGGSLTLRVYRDPFVVLECCDTGPSGQSAAAPAADEAGDFDQLTRSWRPQDLARPAPSAAPVDRRKIDQRLEAAREIVTAHRGCVWTRPSGAGTSVIFELPSAGPGDSRPGWRRGR